MFLIFAAGILLSSSSFAASQTVLTIQRVNYKAEKLLKYDVIYDQLTCAINTSKPFDVYYIEKATGQRLADFSSDSADYFGPHLAANRTSSTGVLLQFKAFEEIKTQTGLRGEIVVTSERQGTNCVLASHVSYSNKKYILKHIDLAMKLTFGFPTGIKWVNLNGQDDQLQPVSECIVGSCR